MFGKKKPELTLVKPPEDYNHPDRYLKKAKKAVLIAFPSFDGGFGATEDNLYIVWFSKTLANWKALVSTDAVSGVYFEVTYDGAKKHTYVDMYYKKGQVIVSDNNIKYYN